MIIVLIVLSTIIALEGLLTVWKAFRFRSFFTSELERTYPEPEKWPKVAVLAPCKGIDPNMEQNIQSWLDQDYPDFDIFFVVESEEDPALSLVQRFSKGPVLVAGRAVDCGQKIHNLRFAIKHIPEEFEVFAFVDSDAKLQKGWLRSLLQRLLQDSQGVATGYRWFLAREGDVSTNLRAVWNSSVLTLYESTGQTNFAWGGSMSILRKTFFETAVLDFWKGSLSDDYGLTRAMRAAGRPIHFVPAAMALTDEQNTFAEFFHWASRQLLITRIYHRRLWNLAFLFHAVWFVWVVLGISLLSPWFLWLYPFTHLCQVIKAETRLSCAGKVFATVKPGHRVYYWLLPPVMALCNFLLLLRNFFSRKIRWRDIEYVIVGPDRLEIRHRPNSE